VNEQSKLPEFERHPCSFHGKDKIVECVTLSRDEYNRARLCVNACAGVENETLAVMGATSFAVSQMRRIAKLEAQNKELVAALDKIAWNRHPSEKCSAVVEKLEKMALAALAKAGAEEGKV
jgi:hypothetical protein